MNKVLVCKSTLLKYSETFIREQYLAYRSWKPVLVGLRRVQPGLTLDGLDVRLLEIRPPSRIRKLLRKVMAEVQWAPAGWSDRLKREQAAIAHVHFGTEGVLFWPILMKLGIPVVITLHGYDINIKRSEWERGLLPIGDRRYPGRLLALATEPKVHFVAVSEAIRQRAIAYGIPSEKISVKYTGIDTSQFRVGNVPISQRRPRILYVGRLVEKKGCEYLLQAYANIKQDVPAAELIVVGDGPLLPQLRQLAQELSIPVQFLGALSAADVKSQLDEARIFCLPSVTARDGDAEGFGMVLLEAQACGVPVITSALGGATEGMAHRSTGIAFQERDVGALSHGLREMLTNDSLAEAFSHAGPEFVRQRFDIRKCTQALEDLYNTLTRVQ